MPHINRIRVNNVKYNFGTQFYDDFIMRFSCRNTIYDLANGGGKSVLMLLLLQNLIPNCTLDEKQPIEKLFRTSEGSKTIHSLIEWRLSDIHVKNNYKYMLTGFCARKAKDDVEAGSFKEIALVWEDMPVVTGEDTSVRASRGSKAGFVKLVLNFLTSEGLMLESEGRYYPKDKFKALIENYFESYKGRLYEILRGDKEDAAH